jgi:alkylated DNA repair protein (DNA oxidative demethylase)
VTQGHLPEGLLYRPGFVSEEEEAELLGFVEGLDFQAVVMRGQTARRTVRHFGFDYDYERHGRLTPADPLPEPLVGLARRAEELGGLEPGKLEQALVSRYPPGAGIGWHRDAPMFGSTIVGVSLLSSCRLRVRRDGKDGRRLAELELAPRSAYVLTGSARWAWQHSIPDAKDLRYSITFRSVRARAQRGE